MRERVIFHCDINNCYASIEILHHPRLRGHPVAVGGSKELRHGIILAKNYEAKEYDIRVGEPVVQALQKCKNLLIVPPTRNLYSRVSRDFKAILSDYTDKMESFGLDEEWMDMTNSLHLFSNSAEKLANDIRQRVYREIGVTISIGVANNKIFAKMGSDYQKPNACTVITKDNYKDILWPLPAGALLGVGPSAAKKLANRGVKTIGQIATIDAKLLQKWFGKWGLVLHRSANGYDDSPVDTANRHKNLSIGNSTTTPRDLVNEADCRFVFLNLAESVAQRVRELGYKAKTIEISLRDNALHSITRQVTTERPTDLAVQMADIAVDLLRKNYTFEKPLRSIGIRATGFIPAEEDGQLTFFDDCSRVRWTVIEGQMDSLRHRFGHYSIGRASLLKQDGLRWINPRTEHIINPVGYF